jgi:trehalose 6-phosphate phosphatase
MIPHASERLAEWRSARSPAAPLLVALDFDGTLAPIAPHPDAVRLPRAVAAALRALAARADTRVAVVSGRGLDDVRRHTAIEGLYYAGNHGMEIDGPDVREHHTEAADLRPALDGCLDEIRRQVGAVPGVVIEDKGLTLSVHYRLVPTEAEAAAVRTAVIAACGGAVSLRVTEGKRVVEVRPDVDWHKGRAILLLLDALTARAGAADALFIGDDVTDEDGFRALRSRGGAGIVVGDPPPAGTAATHFLRTTVEVADFLEALAAEPA